MKILPSFVFISFLSVSLSAQAAINPANLIKVTNEANPKCVEYYSYHGDMYCSIKPLLTEAVDPNLKDTETQLIVFDDRPWQAVWGKKTSEITTLEYVPLGDDINNWHELVTSQFFPGLQNVTTPQDYAKSIIKQIEDSGFKPNVTFIKNSPDQTIFEFRIDSPKNQIQDELQMITKGKDGMYVLHYVIKEKDMGKERREQWLQNFSKSKIK